jgi:hypothetical protein
VTASGDLSSLDGRDVELPPTSRGRGSAVALLTIYLVLLLAIPSNVRIAAFGSMGRPSLLWGLVLFGWWVLWRLIARASDLPTVRQPVRVAYFAFLTVALISLAAALFRGQPPDQVSPAMTSILRLLSWGGVLLVGLDGVRTYADAMTLCRRIAFASGLLALLGLVQFLTRQSLLDWVSGIPGLEVEEGGLQVREAFVRASGTAIHPLEHSAALSAGLPLAVGVAVERMHHSKRSLAQLVGWIPVGLIALGSILAVSRSALIGFGVAALAALTAVPGRLRTILIGAGLVAAAGAVVATPGLFGVFRRLFAPGGDNSTKSRTDALDRLPEFVASSPVYGAGFGTFLPRYYIFDNAWALMLVELGLVGLLTFVCLFGTALLSGVQAGWSHDDDLRVLGRTLAAAVVSLAVVFAFFDAMSFPIAAGIAFLLFGISGAVRGLAATEPVNRL